MYFTMAGSERPAEKKINVSSKPPKMKEHLLPIEALHQFQAPHQLAYTP